MLWFKKKIKEKIKQCSDCKKQHTMKCPNSSKCYDTESKIYFEDKKTSLNSPKKSIKV